jgi:hypothetical protein
VNAPDRSLAVGYADVRGGRCAGGGLTAMTPAAVAAGTNPFSVTTNGTWQ